MKLTSPIAALTFLMLGPVTAGAQPVRPPVRTPGLSLAVEAAQAAVAACQTRGFRTAVIVANAAGTPVAMLAADGSSARLQQVVGTKIATVVKYGVASGDIVQRAASDPALAAEIKADPAISAPRAGGLPIRVGDEIVGIIAVGGATPSEADTACAQAGIDVIAQRLG